MSELPNPMKLIIQIPCFNEAQSLPITLPLIPRQIPGFSSVEILIIDDGSTDNTIDVARAHGVDHIIQLKGHQGLARAFMAGINASLNLGAHIIVNTDADNQYNSTDIARLTAPILSHEADIAVGVRPINEMKHFSTTKKILQKLGSALIRFISTTNIIDAPSGFRAISRDAALRINIFTEYSYTLEMLIQAGEKNLVIKNVPIRVNPDLRPSRLVKNTLTYVLRSAKTIIRVFVIYHPFRFFFTIGSVMISIGTLIGIRYLWFIWAGEGKGHIQSVVLSTAFIIIGFQVILIAFLAQLQAINRRIQEDIQYRLRKAHP